MKNRIKESIGDLITDEQLTVLLEKALDEMFLQERIVTVNYNTTRKAPLLYEIIKECLQAQVYEVCREYVKNNQEIVEKTLDQVIKDGAGEALVRGLTGMFNVHLMNLRHNIISSTYPQ